MFRLVMVEWEDTVDPVGEWRFISTDSPMLDVLEVRSVGWVVGENDAVLMLAPNIGDMHLGRNEVQGSGFIRIPKGCIKLMSLLKESNLVDKNEISQEISIH